MPQAIIVIVGVVIVVETAAAFAVKLRRARQDTASLLHSLSTNAESNLGVALDVASIEYFIRRPFLAARIWDMLSSAGGPYGIPAITGDSPYASLCNDLLARHIRNDQFKSRYPCAHALIQYAVYLCDVTVHRDARCPHPNPRVRQEVPQAMARAADDRRLGQFIKGRPADVPQNWLKRRIAISDLEQDVAELFSELAEPADELWEFSSPLETWQLMAGRGGVALVRDGSVVAHLIRVMN